MVRRLRDAAGAENGCGPAYVRSGGVGVVGTGVLATRVGRDGRRDRSGGVRVVDRRILIY